MAQNRTRTNGDIWREIDREVSALFTDEPICDCGCTFTRFDPEPCPKDPDGKPCCTGFARIDAAYAAAEARLLPAVRRRTAGAG